MRTEIFYLFQLFNEKKECVYSRRERAHSFVCAFDQILYTKLSVLSFGIIDTNNISRSVGGTDAFSLNALVTDDIFGIVVGSGMNAVTISDYKLQTKILNGSTAGTLQYGAHTFYVPTIVSNYCYTRFSRPFHNATANPITVNETGVIWKDTNSNWYFLIERNIPTPYPIPAGFGGLVTCEFRVTV